MLLWLFHKSFSVGVSACLPVLHSDASWTSKWYRRPYRVVSGAGLWLKRQNFSFKTALAFKCLHNKVVMQLTAEQHQNRSAAAMSKQNKFLGRLYLNELTFDRVFWAMQYSSWVELSLTLIHPTDTHTCSIIQDSSSFACRFSHDQFPRFH